MSKPFPCNSIGNAQCAMANEIQCYGQLHAIGFEKPGQAQMPLRRQGNFAPALMMFGK
ncbi:MAG TPA: hypothetical protein VE961_04360 [Pyrinomonadaceae bacterium]|nr:hypothetical protein [Pyrinomonadaceae bacterium]